MRTIQKVWIAGANGQLGTAIYDLLDSRQVEILNTDLEDVDITQTQEVIMFGDRNRPDAIINCAGMTNVKACEENVEKAFKVNALGARNLSISARKIGARIIHVSTDDVFDGIKETAYNEFDAPNPMTAYGRSKLAGENFVRELAPKHIIIRSTWIYGNGDNFVKNLLHTAREGKPIPVAMDQYGSPTSVDELARLIIFLMDTAEYGLYHATCEGYCSRMEFAEEILRIAGKTAQLIPVAAKESDTSFRPANSILDNFMLRISGVYKMPDWKTALAEYMNHPSFVAEKFL